MSAMNYQSSDHHDSLLGGALLSAHMTQLLRTTATRRGHWLEGTTSALLKIQAL